MIEKKKYFSIVSLVLICFLVLILLNPPNIVRSDYPKQRLNHKMIYDTSNDKVIMYGGYAAAGDQYLKYETWSYNFNNNNWIRLNTTSNPTISVYMGMTFDIESEKIVIFGGEIEQNVASNQTWVFDYSTNSWLNKEPSIAPNIRNGADLVYDSESDLVILFGGGMSAAQNPDGNYQRYNDTWSYDFNSNTWYNISSPTYPNGLQFDVYAYDSKNDKIVLFGGTTHKDAYIDPTGEGYHGETWIFDYNSNIWSNVTPALSPSPRIGAEMVYDSEHEVMIYFGGYTHLQRTEIDHQTWSYNYTSNNWTQLYSSGGLHRRGHKMVYDSESEKTILYGGNTGDDPYFFLNETWVFDYDYNTWTLMPFPELPDNGDNGETTNKTKYSLTLSVGIIVLISILRVKIKRNKK